MRTAAPAAAPSPILPQIAVGGCRVRFTFEGIAPHRAEILHSVPSHTVREGAPEWTVSVLPLDAPAGEFAAEEALHFDGFAVRFAPDGLRRATLHLDGSRRKKEQDTAFSAMLHMILRREGRLDLHAAAVTPDPAKGAILIVGPKGAGKSSLTVNLALDGWSLFSDDHILLWRSGENLRLGSLRAPLYLTPDAVARLPVDGPQGRDIPTMGKRMFEPGALFPGRNLIEGTAAAVVFSERVNEGASSLESIRPLDSFQRLLAQTPYLGADASARPCIEVARSIADLPGFVLRAAPDLLDPGVASRILGQPLQPRSSLSSRSRK